MSFASFLLWGPGQDGDGAGFRVRAGVVGNGRAISVRGRMELVATSCWGLESLQGEVYVVMFECNLTYCGGMMSYASKSRVCARK